MLSVLFNSRKIPVKVPHGISLSETQLNSFKPFQLWLSKLQKNFTPSSNYHLKQIEIQSVDIFKSDKIGFVKLRAEVIHPNGNPIPGVVVLRGGTVGILVILECLEDSNEKYVVLVQQPRVPVAEVSLTELPAGMIDDGTFTGSAARELEEECGFKIHRSDLLDLTANHAEGVLLSPGLVDETIKLYSYTKKMDRQEIHKLNGKITGSRQENENITLKLVRVEKAGQETRDAKVLLALYLYKNK